MTGLSWNWIALAAVVPAIVGVLVAVPFWLRSEPIFGNLAGTAVVFGAAFAFIMREKIAIDRFMQQCVDQGTMCWPEPSAFLRYAVYAFIGLVEVIAIFSLSLAVEARIRQRGYAPEWRR